MKHLILVAMLFAIASPLFAIDNDFNIFDYSYQYPYLSGMQGGRGGVYAGNFIYCYTPGDMQCHLNLKTFRVCQQNKRWSSWQRYSPLQESFITQNCSPL